jgi:hypothetical protein
MKQQQINALKLQFNKLISEVKIDKRNGNMAIEISRLRYNLFYLIEAQQREIEYLKKQKRKEVENA